MVLFSFFLKFNWADNGLIAPPANSTFIFFILKFYLQIGFSLFGLLLGGVTGFITITTVLPGRQVNIILTFIARKNIIA